MSHATTVGNLHVGLEALGVSAKLNSNMYAGAVASGEDPDAQFNLLERFPAPSRVAVLNPAIAEQRINLTTPEFTSLCPITGQPDFATIKIEYVPNKWCVESKALKLYLLSFRNRGEFHEACINRMVNDLARLLNPLYLRVIGEFTPRGGIPIWPTSEFWGNGADEFVASEYANDTDPDQRELELTDLVGGEPSADPSADLCVNNKGYGISIETYQLLVRYAHSKAHGRKVSIEEFDELVRRVPLLDDALYNFGSSGIL